MAVKKLEKPSNGRSPVPKRTYFSFTVVIGIFDGGIKPLEEFLLRLPGEIQNAAIILDPHTGDFPKSLLIQSLKDQTSLLSHAAVNGIAFKNNTIYIVPAGSDVSIRKERLSIRKLSVEEKVAPDLCQLFQSIADEAKEFAIGIVFSSDSKDGAAGLKAIENAGGLAIRLHHYSPSQHGNWPNSSKNQDNHAVFQANNAVKAIRNFTVKLTREAINKNMSKATESNKTLKSKEFSQIDIEKLKTRNIALTFRNQELEIACARMKRVNDKLKRKGRQLLKSDKEITNANQLRENLEQSEAHFKGAFDHSAIGMALVAMDGRWMEVNDSICEIVGYSREELMKITFQDITHPEDLQLDLEYLNELITGKRQSYQMEKRYFHKNGNIIWVLLVVSMLKDKEGKPLHFISQIEDITDRKKIEEDLQISNERYKYVTKATFDAIWDWDLKNDTVYWGEGFQTLFGYNTKILGAEKKTNSKLIHPVDFLQVNEGISRLIAGTGTTWSAEYRYLMANGEYAFVTDNALVVRDENGLGVRMIGAMQDITRKKRE
ncbi:MAG: PAS domain S-box protein [Ferruginibacter sp.]